ncbi:MAG: GntR family transcriptional regulator [Burkholderiales bacterium]|nr:GntR family transcriptional regulator [Burkholderiales bacterium]
MSTLVDKIVQAIRGDIYNGTLHPGFPLKQVELANRYGVSPIPLREALQRLQMEGLVEYFAYRGAIVARLRLAEARDIADIRNALEALAFKIAVPTLDEEQLQRLERVTNELESPKSYQNAAFFLEKIMEYFTVLLANSNRPLLLEMIHTNLKGAVRYYAELLRRRDGSPLEAPSRLDYLAAIRADDVPGLLKMMEARHAAYVAAFDTFLEE